MSAKTLFAAVGLVIAVAVMPQQNAAAGASLASICAWNGFDWSDMTHAQQALWVRLGWDQARWDGNKPPASNAKNWSQLTTDERNAATKLGFGPRSWEATCGPLPKGTLSMAERKRALANVMGD
jgi:hypothetical protein